MSFSRFYSHDPDWVSDDGPFGLFSGWQPRDRRAPEESHTSRMLQPRYAFILDVPSSKVKCFVVDRLRRRMDLYENTEKDLMTATFELPGLSKEDIRLDVHNGSLSVSGENAVSSEQREHGYTIKERRFGKFTRSIRLPEGTEVSRTLEPNPPSLGRPGRNLTVYSFAAQGR